jgi:phosphoglycolate phosphatase
LAESSKTITHYTAVLWDLDGTLTDPKEGITRCMQHTLEHVGVDAPSCDDLEWIIGPPLHSSLDKLLRGDAELVAEGVRVYRERYSSVGIYENLVYDGIPELLRDLECQGVMSVLATFKPDAFARTILSHFGLDGYFSAVVGSSMDGRHMDKRDLVRMAIEKVPQCGLQKIVMVGDRMQDIDGARSNGIDSVGVLYGYGSRIELETAGPTVIVETVEGLRRVLLSQAL